MRSTFKMCNDYGKRSRILVLFLLVTLSACVTNEHATYLQEYEESEYSGEYVPPKDYQIQANDNLYIRVSTPDPRLSEIFNAMGEAGMMQADESAINLVSYPVELDGTVDLPFVGPIEVAGKTIPEAKVTISAALDEYVIDFALTVKLVNNYVSVLGEINNPGMYPIYKERLNIFQALAMAGDVADFSDRYALSIIRQSTEGSIVKEFNITDKKIIDSEFYYVMPNDVIYVKPLKGRFFNVNSAPYTFAFSAIAAVATILVLIQNTMIINQQ